MRNTSASDTKRPNSFHGRYSFLKLNRDEKGLMFTVQLVNYYRCVFMAAIILFLLSALRIIKMSRHGFYSSLLQLKILGEQRRFLTAILFIGGNLFRFLSAIEMKADYHSQSQPPYNDSRRW